jgi:hypothetical protein
MHDDSTNHRSADDPGFQSQTRRTPRGASYSGGHRIVVEAQAGSRVATW